LLWLLAARRPKKPHRQPRLLPKLRLLLRLLTQPSLRHRLLTLLLLRLTLLLPLRLLLRPLLTQLLLLRKLLRPLLKLPSSNQNFSDSEETGLRAGFFSSGGFASGTIELELVEPGRNNASGIVPAFAGTTVLGLATSPCADAPAKAGTQVCPHTDST
jgi:hypothetical protein